MLHILDDEIEAWRQEQEALPAEEEIHVFISDSNGSGLCDAGLEVQPPDIIVSRVEPGRRWVNLSIIIRRDINWWRMAATSFGCTLGVAVIWLSGNDSYPHPRRPSEPVVDPAVMECHILQVLRVLRGAARKVLIVGPVPRFQFDRGLPWERCPAYQAERLLMRVLRREGLASFVELLCVGRLFTIKVRSCRVVGERCRPLFAADGIHLSPAGYTRVLQRLPQWLRWTLVPVRDSEG